MQDGGILGPELWVQNSLINDELSLQLAVGSVVVEFESLYELLLMICVSFKSLDDGHTSLISLDNVHGKVLDVVLVVLCDQVRSDGDAFLVLFVVLTIVVVS